MTRLTIHFPNSTITFDSDNPDKISKLSDFCKNELAAYHSTENINELTVDRVSEEQGDQLYSLLFELELLF